MVFRRRPPLRRRPLGPRQRPLRRRAIRQLKIADKLFEEDQWLPAAEHYERFALGATERGLPKAPQLFLRAGRSRLEHGDQAIGIDHLLRAVKLFGQFGQIYRLSQIRPRIVEELKQRGYERDAIKLDKIIHEILDQHMDAEIAFEQPGSTQRFPSKCASFGASLRPDEMERLDPLTGVCGYCGNVIHAG